METAEGRRLHLMVPSQGLCTAHTARRPTEVGFGFETSIGPNPNASYGGYMQGGYVACRDSRRALDQTPTLGPNMPSSMLNTLSFAGASAVRLQAGASCVTIARDLARTSMAAE